MANPIKKDFSFHESLHSLFKMWKSKSNVDNIILRYGFGPPPWAELKNNTQTVSIPIPNSPGVYKDWRSWMRDYLEDQIALIADQEEIIIKTMGNKGNLLTLNRKEKIEVEI